LFCVVGGLPAFRPGKGAGTKSRQRPLVRFALLDDSIEEHQYESEFMDGRIIEIDA
jgi:hypothetical protein